MTVLNLLQMFATSLVVGVGVGLAYGFVARRGSGPKVGAQVVVAWSRGLGRGKVLKSPSAVSRLKAFLVSSPLMRENYSNPQDGETVKVKVIGDGTFRAQYLGTQDSAWILKKSS